MTAYLFAIPAYLIGSLPVAYLLGVRLYGVDITCIGSRNVGAVNAWRTLGWKPGVTVLIFDAAKGGLVMTAILALQLPEGPAFAAALAVTVGHNFSPLLRLRGGKGVAVVFGLSLMVLPFLTLVSLLVIPIVYRITRGIVWPFFSSFLVLNALTIATGQPGAQVGLCLALSAVVVVTHLWRTRDELGPALLRFDLSRIGRLE